MSTDAGTPTPRTDAAWNASPVGDMNPLLLLARDLERELTALRTAYEAAERTAAQWEAAFNKNETRNIELEQKLEAAQAEIAALQEALETIAEHNADIAFAAKHISAAIDTARKAK